MEDLRDNYVPEFLQLLVDIANNMAEDYTDRKYNRILSADGVTSVNLSFKALMENKPELSEKLRAFRKNEHGRSFFDQIEVKWESNGCTICIPSCVSKTFLHL